MTIRLPSIEQIKKQKCCDYAPGKKKKGALAAIAKVV
jgi:hypothetical protein